MENGLGQRNSSHHENKSQSSVMKWVRWESVLGRFQVSGSVGGILIAVYWSWRTVIAKLDGR